jgi:hypothetical protein
MSEPDRQRGRASFYTSPEQARQASPKEFLYLAWLHGAPCSATGRAARVSPALVARHRRVSALPDPHAKAPS